MTAEPQWENIQEEDFAKGHTVLEQTTVALILQSQLEHPRMCYMSKVAPSVVQANDIDEGWS